MPQREEKRRHAANLDFSDEHINISVHIILQKLWIIICFEYNMKNKVAFFGSIVRKKPKIFHLLQTLPLLVVLANLLFTQWMPELDRDLLLIIKFADISDIAHVKAIGKNIVWDQLYCKRAKSLSVSPKEDLGHSVLVDFWKRTICKTAAINKTQWLNK